MKVFFPRSKTPAGANLPLSILRVVVLRKSAMEIPSAFAPGPYFYGGQLYVRAPKAIEFPSEEKWEEHVAETKRHLEVRTTLYLLLKEAFAAAATGSDQFVYWDATDPKKCLSPDVFLQRRPREALSPEASPQVFDTWKIWERGAPDLAVEIVSASDKRDKDWDEKFARYQASGICEVVRFDPDAEDSLRVWDRVNGELVERDSTSPDHHRCFALGLWWATAPSEYGMMLRLAEDREGKRLLPTPNEERVRLAQELAEERKARNVAEHARIVAEHARIAEERARIASENARVAEEHARIVSDMARNAAEEAHAEAVRERNAEAEARAAAEAEVERLRALLRTQR